VASKGWKIEQIGLFPFRYIDHPQWDHLDLGVYGLLIKWAYRFSPPSKAEAMKNAVFRLRKILSAGLFRRLLPKLKPVTTSASEVEAGPA
jgi:hypothetical protein